MGDDHFELELTSFGSERGHSPVFVRNVLDATRAKPMKVGLVLGGLRVSFLLLCDHRQVTQPLCSSILT